MFSCPLCQHSKVEFFHKNRDRREFYRCHSCDLAFVDPRQLLSPHLEKQRYATHQNELSNKGYQNFLEQMWLPLKEQFHSSTGVTGIDFGCGPTEAFKELAARDGFLVTSYDPYFYPNPNALKIQYDFVWCSEVVEHFCRPLLEFPKLISLLKPNGILAIMTEKWTEEIFADWYYHLDPTHVSFYSDQTMAFLEKNFELKPLLKKERVSLFQKL